MNYQVFCPVKKCGMALGLLFALLVVAGCEGGKEEAAPAAQGLPEFQPAIGGPASRIETLKSRLFDEPENDMLLSALGDAYFEAKRFQEAIPVYEKAVAINPQNYDALNDLGLCYFYTRNEVAALEALDKAVAVNPDYKYAWLSKGFVLVSIGRFQDAEAPLRRAKELDPNGNIGAEAEKFLQKIEQHKATRPPAG